MQMCRNINNKYTIIYKEIALTAVLSLYSTTMYANTAQTIVDDMSLPNAAFPHGMPSNWPQAVGPTVLAGNSPPADWSAMVTKGQVYRDSSDSNDTNTRVQLKNVAAYVLSKSTNKWTILQGSVGATGGSWPENFSSYSASPDLRNAGDGSVAVKLAHGRNFVFWPTTSRGWIDPRDIAGIFTTVQARLVVDDPAKANDISSAKYLIQIGGDYWRSLTAKAAGHNVNNTDIGFGRFKYVTADWQDFNFTTLDSKQLASNPPPGANGAVTPRVSSPAAPSAPPPTPPAPTPTPTPTPTPVQNPPPTQNLGSTAQALMNDMAASEGRAHGTEGWPWSFNGRVSASYPPSGWTSGVGWGTVYRDASNSQDTNTRVALRNIKVYALNTSGAWTVLIDAPITGGHWAENFSSNNPAPASLRREPDGSISDKLQHYYNLHFFSQHTRFNTPRNYLGLVVSVDTRLVLDNPSGRDDRGSAKYLVNVGGDWWKTYTAQHCGFNCNNTEIGYSKFIYVTNYWRTVRFTTLNSQQLSQHPFPY